MYVVTEPALIAKAIRLNLRLVHAQIHSKSSRHLNVGKPLVLMIKKCISFGVFIGFIIVLEGIYCEYNFRIFKDNHPEIHSMDPCFKYGWLSNLLSYVGVMYATYLLFTARSKQKISFIDSCIIASSLILLILDYFILKYYF